MQLINSSKIVQCITPTEGAAGQTAIPGAVIDMSGARGALVMVHMGAITSGAATSLKCQHSDEPAAVYSNTAVGTTYNELREGAATGVKLAASHTTTAASQVKYVYLQLKKQGAVAAGKKLTLTIETNNAGAPSGTALGTAETVLVDSISTTSEWVRFTFAKPVDLAASTLYHYVLAGDYDASATVNICWRSATVASGGNFQSFNGTDTWTATATQDLEIISVDFSFADIAGTSQTIADTDDGEIFYADVSRPSKRYLRAYVSRATQNAAVASAIAIAYGQASEPVTQDAGVNGETHVGKASGTA